MSEELTRRTGYEPVLERNAKVLRQPNSPGPGLEIVMREASEILRGETTDVVARNALDVVCDRVLEVVKNSFSNKEEFSPGSFPETVAGFVEATTHRYPISEWGARTRVAIDYIAELVDDPQVKMAMIQALVQEENADNKFSVFRIGKKSKHAEVQKVVARKMGSYATKEIREVSKRMDYLRHLLTIGDMAVDEEVRLVVIEQMDYLGTLRSKDGWRNEGAINLMAQTLFSYIAPSGDVRAARGKVQLASLFALEHMFLNQDRPQDKLVLAMGGAILRLASEDALYESVRGVAGEMLEIWYIGGEDE